MKQGMFRRSAFAAAFIAAGALTAGGIASAASDGTLGATSQGDLDISAVIPNFVKISSLTDIDLGTWDGSSDMTGTDDLCVFSTTRSYTVTATGDGAGGAFELSDGGTATLPYSVEWQDDQGGSFVSLAAGTTSATNFSAATTSVNCSNVGGTNTTVRVTVTSANAGGAPAGTYNGTLFLEVAPVN